MHYLFNSVSDPRRMTRLVKGFLTDRLERNPGDMVYSFAVMNTIATDESTEFTTTGYYYRTQGFSAREAETFNSECDAFVCPLANMFDPIWIWFVRVLTDFIKRLDIPCIVPCVSVTDDRFLDEPSPIDDDVRAFVGAVLNKSALIGVRGESTACLLRRLGFAEGRHFVVLGCPSAYTYGPSLPDPVCGASLSFGRCAFSMNIRSDPEQWRFIDRCAGLFDRSDYVSQWIGDFNRFLLTNQAWNAGTFEGKPEYAKLLSKYAGGNRLRFFLNRKPWEDFLADADFSVGHRIHGALLAVLSGTPAAVVPFERRTEELAVFHGIPVLLPIPGESDESLRQRISGLDFSNVKVRQRENFANYVRFFRENGVRTVFDDGIPSRKDFPLVRSLPNDYPDDFLPSWNHHDSDDREKAEFVQMIERVRRAYWRKGVAEGQKGEREAQERAKSAEKARAMAERARATEERARLAAERARATEERARLAADKARAVEEKARMAAERRVQAMVKSLSWRVTAPLRAFGRLFTRRGRG